MISKEARGHGLISFRTTRNEEIVATRSKALFLTPEEFVTWLPATAAELGLHIVLDHIPKQPLVYWSGAPAELLAAWRLRLSPEKTDLRHVDPNHFIGQELGWINADVPKVKGRYLREAGTGVKSDWFVSMEEPYRENPEVLKLFDRFWRKDKSRARLSGGTGLGLAITKQHVEAQGGMIEARNLEEGGLQVVVGIKKN